MRRAKSSNCAPVAVPTVETPAEAEALVERQDRDPLIDTSTMPLAVRRP